VSELYRAPVARIVGEDRVHIGARPRGLRADLAASFFVLEHDTDPMGSLRYLRAVTEGSGLLYLMLPNHVTNLADLACRTT
jgi:hypothetical protein